MCNISVELMRGSDVLPCISVFREILLETICLEEEEESVGN